MSIPTRDPAPILLFAYKRLETLQKTVNALAQNELAPRSDLFIFSDSGRRDEDKPAVRAVREYLQTVKGFRSVRIEEAIKNRGLANSIITGVTDIINSHGRAIVLEDDILTTPNFLTFMNAALDKYEQQPRVFSVSGYAFNLGLPDDGAYPWDTYFTTRGWSWGWATWKDRWTGIDWQVSDYAEFTKNAAERRRFAQGGSDLNLMLKRQMSGQLDSWAIRWFYHQYKVQGLTLYPILSKVYNDGFDELATHTRGSNQRYRPLLDETGATSFRMPDTAAITNLYQRRFQKKLGIRARILSKYQTLIGNLLK
jgi:hypothetical protein